MECLIVALCNKTGEVTQTVEKHAGQRHKIIQLRSQAIFMAPGMRGDGKNTDPGNEGKGL